MKLILYAFLLWNYPKTNCRDCAQGLPLPDGLYCRADGRIGEGSDPIAEEDIPKDSCGAFIPIQKKLL